MNCFIPTLGASKHTGQWKPYEDRVEKQMRFAFLGENGCDAVLEVYLPYNMTDALGKEA